MEAIIQLAQQVQCANATPPFSVYTAVKAQKIANVPVTKPTLIFVINGEKRIGEQEQYCCPHGHFLFLAGHSTLHYRNIPSAADYNALLIDFNAEDFRSLPKAPAGKREDFIIGKTIPSITQWLTQFLSIAAWAPPAIIALRKQELLTLLHHLGHTNIAHMQGKLKPSVSQKIHDILTQHHFQEITTDTLCHALAMSPSTLYRKLKAEHTSIQAIKDQARLAFGLHILLTTTSPIQHIAEQCGYLSQSRFSQQFKNRFGTTPSALRKTQQAQSA